MNGDIDSAFKRLEEWYPQVIKVYYTVCAIFLFTSFPQNGIVATKNNGVVIEITFLLTRCIFWTCEYFSISLPQFFSVYSQKKSVIYFLLYNKDFFSAGRSISYLLLTPFSKIH
jgi:hypothetical protein